MCARYVSGSSCRGTHDAAHASGAEIVWIHYALDFLINFWSWVQKPFTVAKLLSPKSSDVTPTGDCDPQIKKRGTALTIDAFGGWNSLNLQAQALNIWFLKVLF